MKKIKVPWRKKRKRSDFNGKTLRETYGKKKGCWKRRVP